MFATTGLTGTPIAATPSKKNRPAETASPIEPDAEAEGEAPPENQKKED